MEKDPIVHIGGDIESALKGDYKLNVPAILKEAWLLTKASRKTINTSLLGVMLLGVVIVSILGQLLGGLIAVQESPQASLIINIVVTVVLAPFLAGIEMFGVMASVGVKTKPKMMFSFLKFANSVVLCALCTSVLTSIGLQLVLPGIYLMVALTLTMPLIIDKQLSPLKAIVISLKTTRFQWFNLFFLHLVLFFALILSLMPLAILIKSPAVIIGFIFFMFALSYLAPMYYHVKGIVYREMFGLDVQAVDAEPMINNNFLA